MPFVPHTEDDQATMLDAIGVPAIESLFDEIPTALRSGRLEQIPEGISEMAMLRLMSERASEDVVALSFLGAGAYEHHIPSAVWDITTRGEFMTAYTPYQAEASQGTLQLIYEFQTMMSRLTDMEVANASVYDGATALAEAILMAVRANKKSRSKRLLCAGNVNPLYLEACRSIVGNQQIEIETIPWLDDTGTLDVSYLDARSDEDFAGLVIAYPSFFGGLEDVDYLTDWAHNHGQLVIGVMNPTALALLKPPGQWGESGADIAVGDGQPLGIPVASGGPYLGYMCCRKAIVRQMPGRIIGRTVDLDGKEGFALTLQAREQHIRRAKATSNICTNQGLLVTAATIYLSLLGDRGLHAVAVNSHNGLFGLLERLTKLDGVSLRFSAPYFHETVLQLPVSADVVLDKMLHAGVLGGFDLGRLDASLANCLLVNVTETKTEQDLDHYAALLAEILAC
jgi:glycine dehydrogenase subunit 1